MLKRVVAGVVVVLTILLAVALIRYLDKGTPADVPTKSQFEVLAHRGVHVNWRKGDYDRITGCEATRIYKPTHEYIENTLESIGAAFTFGATIVEIDVQRTQDNQIVIMHDWGLDCRTNGHGPIGEQPLDYLKQLDIGYGYTYDGGQTYPFRGKGIGKMPTLSEVLKAYPGHKFLLDHKDGSLKTAALLVNLIKALPAEQQQLLSYWGPLDTYAYIHREIPLIKRFFVTPDEMKTWVLSYELTLGFQGFPAESKGLVMGSPTEYTKLFGGWPYRFLGKVADAGSQFYLMIDTEADAKAFQQIPVDGIVTDYIEVVGKYYPRGTPISPASGEK